MKNFTLVLLALCFAGCTHFDHVEFTGTATGVKSGTFIIKDLAGHAIYGDNIKDGKFHVANAVLEVPGYYSMNIVDDVSSKDGHSPYEVYLQDGKYTISTDAAKLSDYPEITSSAPIQQQLSAYYSLANKINSDLSRQENILNTQLNSKNANALPKKEFIALLNKVSAIDSKKREIMSKVLNEFVEKNPQNIIGAHIMLQQDYEKDPLLFNRIYKKLNAAIRNSAEGKAIGEKLSRLVKLVPGATAPVITGKLLNGKPFDPASMHKKIFLVDFWRAGNEISRRNHAQLKPLLTELGEKNFEVISVSMDNKADWWSSAVSEDGITWPQVSDLKGDESPNTLNWSITRIPRYDLVDGNWHIIDRDIPFNSIYLSVKSYLEKHH